MSLNDELAGHFAKLAPALKATVDALPDWMKAGKDNRMVSTETRLHVGQIVFVKELRVQHYVDHFGLIVAVKQAGGALIYRIAWLDGGTVWGDGSNLQVPTDEIEE